MQRFKYIRSIRNSFSHNNLNLEKEISRFNLINYINKRFSLFAFIENYVNIKKINYRLDFLTHYKISSCELIII